MQLGLMSVNLKTADKANYAAVSHFLSAEGWVGRLHLLQK